MSGQDFSGNKGHRMAIHQDCWYQRIVSEKNSECLTCNQLKLDDEFSYQYVRHDRQARVLERRKNNSLFNLDTQIYLRKRSFIRAISLYFSIQQSQLLQ